MTHSAPSLPFPIFRVSPTIERYLLYDVGVVTWLRKTHNILGVLIGTLPQIPSQNVFLSLPLELQPEEARLLVESGIAYVVDNGSNDEKIDGVETEVQRKQLRDSLRREGLEIAKDAEKRRQARSQRAREKVVVRGEGDLGMADHETRYSEQLDGPLFGSPCIPSTNSHSIDLDLQPWAMTPTTSKPTFDRNSVNTTSILPAVKPSSYALFKHLHRHGYFMTPGIRFGCQFSVYPGDPLRFHSHFLAIGADWDQDIDLLHLIGGGRLGTGVKKGWMIGGIQEGIDMEDTDTVLDKEKPALEQGLQVRTFCIEWGGM